MTTIIILVEIASREKNFVHWLMSEVKKRELNIKVYVIYKDDFYNNIARIGNKLKDKKVIVIDKSYQKYMYQKLKIAKKFGFGLILREEEFLVRLSDKLSKDRYCRKNADMADILLVWGDEERNLLINDGISEEKITYGSGARYLNYQSVSLDIKPKYKLLIISSFGDLYPMSGVKHSNKNYIKYLNLAMNSVANLLNFCRINHISVKYRFHPFENIELLISEFNRLGLDILKSDYIDVEYPRDTLINKSLSEAKFVFHIGSTVAYDYYFATRGRASYMLAEASNPIRGPEKVSILVRPEEMIKIILMDKVENEEKNVMNEMIKLPDDRDIDQLLSRIDLIQDRVKSRVNLLINLNIKMRDFLRPKIMSFVFNQRYRSAKYKRANVQKDYSEIILKY